MAKVYNNIFVRGLTGSVGEQFVIKRTRSGKTIISNTPTYHENRVFTPAQLEVHERFKEATVYAKDAKTQAVYVEKAAGSSMTPYNAAVADWFNAPEVKEIDMHAWTGAMGDIIRIKAVDDVQVTQVHVVITDNGGAVLEQGAATNAGGSWWNYTTQTAISGSPRVVATARDLPGHIAELEWED